MNAETYCIAGRLRMLSRVITGRYNEAFAVEGVTFAQAALLMHIFPRPGVKQAELSRTLQIEKSTLHRDVLLLQYNGWVASNIRKGLFLTDEGTTLAKRCHKIWKNLNQQIRDELGPEAVSGLSVFSEKLLNG